MSARAYTVDKRGRKRLASSGVSVHFMESSALIGPRERLLRFVGADGSQDYMGADARKHTRTVRRLLRAVLHEAAVRACWAASVHGYKKSGDTRWHASQVAIRAAILGPQRAKKGGER